MKLVYLLLFTIVFLSCQEKPSSPQTLPHASDELESLLLTETDGHRRLEVYRQLFEFHRYSDADHAEHYLDSMSILAEAMGDARNLGKVFQSEGILFKRKGNYLKATDAFLKAINLFSTLDEPLKVADNLNNAGVIFMGIKNYDYAIQFLVKARETYVEMNDGKALLSVDISLARCFFMKKEPDYPLAEHYYREALEINAAVSAKQAYYNNKIYNQWGLLCVEKGDYRKARSHYLKSLDYAECLGNPMERKLIAYSNLGEVSMKNGDFPEAEEWLEKALSLHLATDDKDIRQLMVGAYNIMAHLQQGQDDHEKALVYMNAALELADKDIINEALQETLTLFDKSYKALDEKEGPMAKDKYRQLLEIHEEQDRLEKEMKEKTDFTALQAALNKQVELRHIENRLNHELSSMVSQEIFLLAVIFVVFLVACFLYRKYLAVQKKVSLACQELEEIRNAVN